MRIINGVVRVENACPAIVDKETFNKVKDRLRERAPAQIHPKRAASRFLLSGLARCGYCGKALVGQDAKGGQFSYYVCGTLNKKEAGSCPALLNNSSLAERRAFIRSFVKEVKVTGDEVLLTYTMPLPPTGVSEENVGVLSAVHHGGRYWT